MAFDSKIIFCQFVFIFATQLVTEPMTYGVKVGKETSMLTAVDQSFPLKPNLKDFWRLESIGINESPVVSDDSIALDKFNETL